MLDPQDIASKAHEPILLELDVVSAPDLPNEVFNFAESSGGVSIFFDHPNGVCQFASVDLLECLNQVLACVFGVLYDSFDQLALGYAHLAVGQHHQPEEHLLFQSFLLLFH
jgi:hypothetical protein